MACILRSKFAHNLRKLHACVILKSPAHDIFLKILCIGPLSVVQMLCRWNWTDINSNISGGTGEEDSISSTHCTRLLRWSLSTSISGFTAIYHTIQDRFGASTQPCLTPGVVWIRCDRSLPCGELVYIGVFTLQSALIRFISKKLSGAPRTADSSFLRYSDSDSTSVWLDSKPICFL